MNIVIINGPNLNLLGKRESDIYGLQSMAEVISELKMEYPEIHFAYYQSNVEGKLINKIQEVGFSANGIILNAGAYTHTSVAIGDAIRAITTPVVEVHISNIFAREDYRHTSFISPHAKGCITGFGTKVYRLAVESFLK
ncbi:MAG: type II 3-dehydroquinate dehydratase [Bacteroidales bacterium]|nr:type II 3-dehydroquinate dehydratase [Bacteroidales bacterium]MDZ4205104.1 type II 3-dehydroquinate dehydratase [Bacteroidales bacterium]